MTTTHLPMTGDELRSIRQTLGLSTTWLARHLGIAKSALRRWEAAGSEPVPVRLRAEVLALRAETERQVALALSVLEPMHNPVMGAYRRENYTPFTPGPAWPFTWYRAFVARLRNRVPGLDVIYSSKAPS